MTENDSIGRLNWLLHTRGRRKAASDLFLVLVITTSVLGNVVGGGGGGERKNGTLPWYRVRKRY